MYDICNEDFADHVRHANNWTDLAIRCGNDMLDIQNSYIIPQLKKKVINMKLNLEHFQRQPQDVDDDVFIKIVKECDCASQVAQKCVSIGEKKGTAITSINE